MSEADEGRRPRDITRLILKAVRALPEEEQQAVFEYFFEQGIARPPRLSPSFGPFVEHAQHIFATHKAIGSEQITIPVRLSEEQHQRLKQWAAKHNFPMAVVVRGLIERFLDDWEGRIPRPS